MKLKNANVTQIIPKMRKTLIKSTFFDFVNVLQKIPKSDKKFHT